MSKTPNPVSLKAAVSDLLSITIETTLEDTIKEVSAKHNLPYDSLFNEFNNYLEGYGEIGN